MAVDIKQPDLEHLSPEDLEVLKRTQGTAEASRNFESTRAHISESNLSEAEALEAKKSLKDTGGHVPIKPAQIEKPLEPADGSGRQILQALAEGVFDKRNDSGEIDSTASDKALTEILGK